MTWSFRRFDAIGNRLKSWPAPLLTNSFQFLSPPISMCSPWRDPVRQTNRTLSADRPDQPACSRLRVRNELARHERLYEEYKSALEAPVAPFSPEAPILVGRRRIAFPDFRAARTTSYCACRFIQN